MFKFLHIKFIALFLFVFIFALLNTSLAKDNNSFEETLQNLKGSANQTTKNNNTQKEKAIDKGLVAHYLFNGNADDLSNNNNDAKVYGASLTKNRFGKSNSAYSFDGVNDYIDIPTSVTQKPMSILIWVNINSSASDSDSIITAVDDDEDYNDDFELFNTFLYFTKKDIDSNFDIRNKGWTHLALIINGSKSKLYINNSLIKEFFDLNVFNNGKSDNLTLMVKNGPKNGLYHFNSGKIDEVRIYNRALSKSEIQKLYRK